MQLLFFLGDLHCMDTANRFLFTLQDMHYAEFAENEVVPVPPLPHHSSHAPQHTERLFPSTVESAHAQTDALTTPTQSQMLLNAIKEYEANKWKVIGQKVGKPAKVRLILCRVLHARLFGLQFLRKEQEFSCKHGVRLRRPSNNILTKFLAPL